MSAIDDRLRTHMLQLAERLESEMPKGIGTMVWFYNTDGADLDVTMCCAHESASETLRILRATTTKLLREEGGGDSKNERWYTAPAGGSPSAHLVSSAAVTVMGGHERVRLWNRGGLAGELVVVAGDAAALVEQLGLVAK